MQRRITVTNYTAISIKECHWDNSQMCNMGAEKMMGIIIVLNKFTSYEGSDKELFIS
jgi:hypothetical protein